MKLSKYLATNETKWNEVDRINVEKIIHYLKEHIDVDLIEIAKSDDEQEIFRNLYFWLFNFYHQEFLDALDDIGYDYQKFKKSMIYSFILSVTRDKSNIDILYDVLVSKGVIEKMLIYEDGTYEILTKEFGNIMFRKAEIFHDKETKEYLNSLGKNVIDGCHEISFFLIKKDSDFKAVTSICTKNLGCRYYHSFVLEEQNVIDLTANLVMPKSHYYLLQEVEELNITDYEGYLREENESVKFDESKTLFGLLRNALYKQYIKSKELSDK